MSKLTCFLLTSAVLAFIVKSGAVDAIGSQPSFSQPKTNSQSSTGSEGATQPTQDGQFGQATQGPPQTQRQTNQNPPWWGGGQAASPDDASQKPQDDSLMRGY